MGEKLLQTTSTSLILNCEPIVINTTAAAQIIGFHTISGDSFDHRPQHGLWWRHSPKASTWLQVAKKEHRHSHNSWLQQGSQAPSWPLTATGTTDTTVAPQNTGINIISSGNTDRKHEHDSKSRMEHNHQHGFLLTTWITDANLASSSIINHERPHGPWSSTAQGKSMEHRRQHDLWGITDQGGLLRRLNSINEPFVLHLEHPVAAQSQGDPAAGQCLGSAPAQAPGWCTPQCQHHLATARSATRHSLLPCLPLLLLL